MPSPLLHLVTGIVALSNFGQPSFKPETINDLKVSAGAVGEQRACWVKVYAADNVGRDAARYSSALSVDLARFSDRVEAYIRANTKALDPRAAAIFRLNTWNAVSWASEARRIEVASSDTQWDITRCRGLAAETIRRNSD